MSLILEQISKKNKKVFKTFFNKNYKELVVYANSYLFDKSSSEDIVQDVFIYIWENADKLKIERSLKGYLYAMVRNRCFNFLKSVKITDNYEFLEFNPNLTTEHVLESATEDDKKTANTQILEVVDSLPDRMQQIVKLKFVHNYKYSEISEELGISTNTVKTQLKRAKLRITDMTAFILILLQIHP